ncbi:hypothetical protein IFM89_004892, partial [Coptis chinensis]
VQYHQSLSLFQLQVSSPFSILFLSLSPTHSQTHVLSLSVCVCVKRVHEVKLQICLSLFLQCTLMSNKKRTLPTLVLLLLISFLVYPCLIFSTTDPADFEALQVVYTSLNSPSQLTGWKSSNNGGGGDPCGENWKGIICEGSSIVSIQVSGLGLSGTMGYTLSDLLSLRTLDMSDNEIHDTIPYQLPLNLTNLNLASNNLSGNLPYSLSVMGSLNFLNVSHNSLSQSLGDIFANLQDLYSMDLSYNNFTGDIPNSFSSLSNLSTLYVQNNQLTGSVNVLVNLPLANLNLANNRFSGWLPPEFILIPNLIYDGNSFANGPAPPPPPYTSPPPSRSYNNNSHNGTHRNAAQGSNGQGSDSVRNRSKGLTVGPIVGIVLGTVLVSLFVMVAFVFCLRKDSKGKHEKESNAQASVGTIHANAHKGSFLLTVRMLCLHPRSSERISPLFMPAIGNGEARGKNIKSMATVADLKPLPAEKLVGERELGNNGSGNRVKSPITATSYTVASLQTATNSFSQECLVGEGSLGRVYKAEFPSGKVLAVKKMDSAAISLQEEDNFLEAVSNMSRLRHSNIITLVGYCAEHGQRLLVYDYIGIGTLHDLLHFPNDSNNILSWNARVKVALGTARALEYLHEVCLPLVVHRNLKSANILLDEDLNPHLSDSGLAALAPNTERQVSSQMVGSFGYSAPEFAMSGIYNVKSDVYSFGVVMLELLTGRKPLDSSRVRSEQSLVRWATPQLHDIDALAKMVDPALNGIYPAKSLSRFADVIALCVQVEPEFRPPMSEVVQALVRLMQRASVVKRRSSEESGFPYRTPDYEALEMSF